MSKEKPLGWWLLLRHGSTRKNKPRKKAEKSWRWTNVTNGKQEKDEREKRRETRKDDRRGEAKEVLKMEVFSEINQIIGLRSSVYLCI